MANSIYIAVSLDGFIARPDGGVDWLPVPDGAEDGDFGFSEFMSRIDAVVMGRRTLETVLGFNLPVWPYEKPVFVLSTSRRSVPEYLNGKAEIIGGGNVRETLARLNARGFRDLYIDGGKTIQGFLAEDLIDEMIITTIPVILGGGISLFGAAGKELGFAVEKIEGFGSRMVKIFYRRLREPARTP
ncbi:MAG: dihydrofolate reductase family protein [Spirochaetaceae bacterium]|nr:dihydrofolate reductase family protein [Spirochaetaceae bacterium]